MECDAVWRWAGSGTNTKMLQRHRHAMNPQRYRDNGELRYSMRSFAAVRGIRLFHIIAREAPDWLNLTHPRIRWWSEQKIVSRVCAMHNFSCQRGFAHTSEPTKLAAAALPELAERFIFIDDDYVWRARREPTPKG